MKKTLALIIFFASFFYGSNITAQTTVSSQISASLEDVEEIVSSGTVNGTSGSLEVSNDTDGVQLIGLHFKNLNIPIGAVIDSASVEFVPSNQSPDQLALNVYAEAANNPQIWSTSNSDVSNRTKTTTFVNLSPFDYNVIPYGAGIKMQSHDLSSIIQEVVNRSGYLSQDALNLIVERDFGGNQAVFSYDGNATDASKITVIYSTDTQDPTTSTLSSTAQSDTTVDLSWTAATDNNVVTGYKVYKDAVLETTLGSLLTYQVTGLTANTAYNFTVTALDAAGNESVVSNTVAITTNSSVDTQAPTTPTVSSTTQTDSSVALTWTAATDDTAVTGYKVYKGGVLETTLGNVLTYVVTGLTANTAYSFTVRAIDAAGNESVDSNTISTTTNNAVAGNFLDTSTWTVGSGSVVGFNIMGTTAESTREQGTDPHGSQNILWKAQPVENDGSKRGWSIDYFNIDHTKTYRYSSWIKKTNSNDGTIYYAFRSRDDLDNSAMLNIDDDALNVAPRPFKTDTPNIDEWYLLVGYIHESGHSLTTSIGGLYDTNGVKQTKEVTDFKFSNTATRVRILHYLEFSTNTSDEFFSYDPTFYEVNGSEPTLQELLDGPQDTQAPTAPTVSSSTKTETTVDLSWTAATDNTAVTGYKVYKDAVLESTLGNVLSYQVTGLTASTAYNFTVTALNAAGNESVMSNTLVISTETNQVQSLQEWNRKQAITINSNLVEGTSTLADFPFLVTLDHLNSEIVDAGPNSALNGGGDLRFSSDSAGNNRLAAEVVEFVTDASTANRKCQVWVKIPSLSATNTTTIYVWYNKTGETQPSPSAPYGSRAVWSNYYFVSHDGLYDSATNQSLTVSGSPTTGLTPYGGTSWKGNGTTDYNYLADGGIDLSGNISVSVWKKNTSTPNVKRFISLYNTSGWLYFASHGTGTSSAGNAFFVSEPASETTGEGARFYPTSDPNGWHYFSISQTTPVGENELMRGDGTGTNQLPTTGYVWGRPSEQGYISLGNRYGQDNYLDGELAEVRISLSVISPEFSDTDYNNMSNPAAFAFAGTPEDADSGSSGGNSGTGNLWILNNQNIHYSGGNVGIGTTTPDEALAVNGNIHAKEVRVDLNGWPDYVFTDEHHLLTLKELENHIKSNGHLPNIPSAKEVEKDGIQLGDMNKKLLEKIEELMLYTIHQQKLIKEQAEMIEEIKEKLEKQ